MYKSIERLNTSSARSPKAGKIAWSSFIFTFHLSFCWRQTVCRVWSIVARLRHIEITLYIGALTKACQFLIWGLILNELGRRLRIETLYICWNFCSAWMLKNLWQIHIPINFIEAQKLTPAHTTKSFRHKLKKPVVYSKEVTNQMCKTCKRNLTIFCS